MDAVKDFIIERLKKLSNMFKGISIKYAFDSITEFHIIEISPENIRRRDDEYIRWESDMWNDFFAMFPDEDLLISSNDMHNVLFDNIPIVDSGNLLYCIDLDFGEMDSFLNIDTIDLLAA
mgnify:CR=1 FL=1